MVEIMGYVLRNGMVLLIYTGSSVRDPANKNLLPLSYSFQIFDFYFPYNIKPVFLTKIILHGSESRSVINWEIL